MAITLNEFIVFFTADRHWLTRQPPYKHGGIIFLDVGNLPMEEKAKMIIEFLSAFHLRNKRLDVLKNRRFRRTRNTLFEAQIGGEEERIA
ncbi:unnamed protein product [marine sediment metagenome]|uniref:Uncharacterized protein n=1 Tax=marine sediment metagenome TaxID=412755 RepID=X1EUI6_9ZZZZ